MELKNLSDGNTNGFALFYINDGKLMTVALNESQVFKLELMLDTFGKTNVLKGDLSSYIDEKKPKRNYSLEYDSYILSELEACGVDNWNGYGEMFYEDEEGEEYAEMLLNVSRGKITEEEFLKWENEHGFKE